MPARSSFIDGAQAVGAIPVSASRRSTPTSTRLPARSGCSAPKGPARCGGVALKWTPIVAAAPSLVGWFSPYELIGLDGSASPTTRRPAGSRRRELPPAVGRRPRPELRLAVDLASVGLPWAHERAGRLAAAGADRLAAIDGVSLVTPPPRDGDARHVPDRAAGRRRTRSRELGARTFAIIRDLPPIDAIRISVGFWNTEEELERFAQGVELLAAHTPESIPPRRTLAVLGSDDSPLR